MRLLRGLSDRERYSNPITDLGDMKSDRCRGVIKGPAFREMVSLVGIFARNITHYLELESQEF